MISEIHYVRAVTRETKPKAGYLKHSTIEQHCPQDDVTLAGSQGTL